MPTALTSSAVPMTTSRAAAVNASLTFVSATMRRTGRSRYLPPKINAASTASPFAPLSSVWVRVCCSPPSSGRSASIGITAMS